MPSTRRQASDFPPAVRELRASAALSVCSREREPPPALARRGWRPLIDPGFGQGFMPETEVKTEVDRLDAVVGGPKIELRAIALDIDLRSGYRELDRATRRGDHGLNLRALRQRRELTADEINRETPREGLALLPDSAADAGSRGHHMSEGRLERRAGAPMDAITREQLLARPRFVEGTPERHDVIGGLVRRRDLYELDGAFAPASSA